MKPFLFHPKVGLSRSIPPPPPLRLASAEVDWKTHICSEGVVVSPSSIVPGSSHPQNQQGGVPTEQRTQLHSKHTSMEQKHQAEGKKNSRPSLVCTDIALLLRKRLSAYFKTTIFSSQ